MAIVPKSAVLQVRLDPRFLERLKVVCQHADVTPAQAARVVLETYVLHAEHSLKKAAKPASETISSVKGDSVLPAPEKSPVGAVNKPMSLSEKRKAEKVAKEARKARREDRY